MSPRPDDDVALAAAVGRAIAKAPPLTPRQVARLAVLLNPAPSSDTAAA